MRKILLFSLLYFYAMMSYGQSITVSPNTAIVGQTISVTISNTSNFYLTSSTTTTTCAAISNATGSYTVTGTASTGNDFSGNVTFPPGATSGDYDVTIYQNGCAGASLSCSNCFTLTSVCNSVVSGSTENLLCNGGTDGSIDIDGGPGLTTTLAGGNNFAGNFFDVTINSPIVLTGLDVRLNNPPGTINTVSVFYKTGTHIGSETVAGDWTLLDTIDVASNGAGATAFVDLDNTLPLSTGDYAFLVAVDGDAGQRMEYSNGTAVGTALASDTYLTIYEGLGTSGVDFANMQLFNPRNWNGTFRYSVPASPTTYLWSNGSTSEDLSGLSAGVYTVTVTGPCLPAIDSFTITEPTAVVISESSTDELCANADGTASISVSGGVTPYAFEWFNGSTTDSISNLSTGLYSVSVTDANGCVNVTTITVGGSGLPVVSESVTNVSCFGQTNGSASVAVTGGLAPYTYLWNNGATIANITALASGTYNCTVTDANGCVTLSNSVTVTEPTALTVTETGTDNACNGGSTGSATVSVAGGTTPYSFLWSNGETLGTITGLSAGLYTCTVTDANGCVTLSNSVIVTEPTALTVAETGTDNACNGGSTGSATVSVAGGTTPYSFLWSNGETLGTITGLSAGQYTCTVTDANGCVQPSSTIMISEPVAISVTTTVTNVTSGNDGAIDVTVIGGIAPYTYLWSTGATTEVLSGLTGGTYTVTITDANGCTASQSAEVEFPIPTTTIQPLQAVKLFPNPTSNTISISGLSGTNIELSIYTATGQLVKVLKLSNGSDIRTIDVSDLTTGVYQFQVIDGKQMITKKVMIK